MTKQVKFSIDEVNKIVGEYCFNKGLLGNVKAIDVIFQCKNRIEDCFIVVSEKNEV